MLCLLILPQVSRGPLTLQRVSLHVNEARRLNDSQSVATRSLPALDAQLFLRPSRPPSLRPSLHRAAPWRSVYHRTRVKGGPIASLATSVPLAARPILAAFRRGDLGSCVEPAEAENTPWPVQVLWIHFVVNAPFGFALGLRLAGTMKLSPWPNRPGKPEVPVIRS